MKTYQTWIVTLTDGTEIPVYGKKSDILDHITARQYLMMAKVEVLNRGDDKVNHKPLTKEQLV